MKVLIAIDDDGPSHDAVSFAQKLLPADAEIIVLNVARFAWRAYVTPSPMGGGLGLPEAEQVQAAIDEHASKIAAEVAAQLGDAETDVEHGPPGMVICSLAEEEDIDLIVVGTHDRGLWSRLWFGSVSRYVVDHAPCPVLVVR